jgi:murE/murF fusion protein
MNHPGEIAILAAVTQPTVALVNNAQREHQEFMVSVEAVALENAAVFDSLMPGGTKVYPADDPFTSLWADLAGQHASSTFGLTAPARVWASDIDSDVLGSSFVLHTPLGQAEVVLPVPGMHNVRNALAATACALASGAPLAAVVQGLKGFRAANGRMQPHRLENGRVLIDDTYNANPDSMEAALSTLRFMPSTGRRIAVLGKMGELGEYANEGYSRTGCAAAKYADVLVTVGSEARQISEAARGAGLSRIHEVEDTSAAARILDQLARSGDLVLVKGSRSARMETLFQKLQS